ncbi:hypothetical protein TRICI_001970 [Trichomonascus ciferrii]|uniref:Fork-head domain-containing protein n=1 Tax=Trichomonascus ciferrii TaxID=44093 RepID=A0A642V8H0_9ASCO|nr:hypothetical protein TRICI_001970 [Trichomonascus ciferrii]
MSNQSPTKDHAKGSLPTLDSNLLKSLNSVHLPPPPSSANQSIMYNRRSSADPGQSEYSHHKDSSFVTPLFINKSSGSNNPLADISANPVLNTPPPSQLRNANVQTPTLRGRDDKENHLISPPVHANVPTAQQQQHYQQQQQQFHHQQPQPQQQFYHQQPQPQPQQQQQQQRIQQAGGASTSKTVVESRPAPPQFRIPEPHEMPPLVDDGKKPPFSYATLIGMAILRSPKRKLTLAQIYQWINDTFEWYRNSKSGWQNSIRHNLSLNKAFKKQERPKSDPGKGNYWLVESGCEHQFINVKAVRRASTTTTTTHHHHHSATSTGSGPNELTYSTFPAAAAATTTTTNNSSTTNPNPATTRHHAKSASAAAAAAAAAMAASSSAKNSSSSNAAAIADRQHEHSSTDEEVNDDDGDGDDYTTFPPPPPPMLPTNNNNNGDNGSSWSNEETPLKRCNTAIGLQHFSKTNFNVESPLTKRTASSLDSDFETSAPFKRQRLFDDAPSWGAPQQNQNTPIIQESPGGHNYITGGGQGLILGPLKPSTMLPPPNSAQKMISPNTSLRNHRAMVKGLTSPSSMEFEDTLDSPSTRKMYNYQQHAFMSAEDDDAVSRAIFGSPDKREARRRQYFEQSGVMGFDGAESVTDVFGVDVCDVVRRAIEHGDPSNKNSNDHSDDDDNDSDNNDQPNQPNNNDSNANDIIRFDSPIKTQGNVFSPPKMVRKNTAYF